MNTVALIGRLVCDPEMRYTPNGKEVCNFRIAVDNPFNKEQKADFFSVVLWGATAKVAAENLEKGREVGIVGRLQSRTYEGKDGRKNYVVEVLGQSIKFIGKRSSGAPVASQAHSEPDPNGGFTDMEDDDDIPF